MRLVVEKYGGTSVGSADRINAVAERVASSHRKGERLVVVVSAMSGETNRLIALANEINPNASAREMDVLVSTGEQVTIALLAMALQSEAVSVGMARMSRRADGQLERPGSWTCHSTCPVKCGDEELIDVLADKCWQWPLCSSSASFL